MRRKRFMPMDAEKILPIGNPMPLFDIGFHLIPVVLAEQVCTID